MANIIEIKVTAENLVKPVLDEVNAQARSIGRPAGERIGKEMAAGIEDTEGDAGDAGDRLGRELAARWRARMAADVKQGLADDVEKPLEDSGKKGGEKGGKAAGAAFSQGASPLMLSAFAAAATVGPGLILAGTAAAVLGAGVLITKGNADLKASYQQLGTDASQAITDATAPLVPQLQNAVGILDQGIGQTGDELKGVFAAVAPDAQDIAHGIVSLVDNALPGLTTGLKAIAPYSHEIAQDFGKLGTGVGDLFAGLAGGAGGGMQGFSAIVDVASHLLADIGQIAGALSNGLGPALHDIDMVAVPVAAALTDVVKAIPPVDIRAAADAAVALFAAFKLAALAGLVEEGTGFVAFLKAASAGEIALTGETGVLTTAMGGLNAAMDAALGPVGAVVLALSAVQQGMDMAQHKAGGLADVLKKTQAQHDATVAAAAHAATVNSAFTATIEAQAGALGKSAQQQAVATLAALGLTDGNSNLTTSLYNTLQAYSGVTAGASAYNTMLQALDGTSQSLDDAQNTLAQDVLNLRSQFKKNGDTLDLNTQAGINNRQALSAAAKAANALAGAQYQATGDMNKANQTLRDQENAILNSTGATGKARDAIKAYLDQILKIPPNVTTTVSADTSAATSQVRSMVEYFDHQVAYVQVYAAPGGLPGGRQLSGQAHGGIVGAASAGGPRSNLTWVGEHGPELVNLAPGSTVRSNPDSMRMAGQQQGGHAPQALDVTFSGDTDSAFASAFMRMIREGKIQIRQKAIVS